MFRPDVKNDPNSAPIGLEDMIWLIVGWIILYGIIRWLRTDGSEYDKGLFDDSWWPVAILVAWPIVYWGLGHVHNWALTH
jgi:hypothetical protein